MFNSNIKSYQKVICLISFTFILVSLIILIETLSTQVYEISIYEIIPWYFWVIITIPLILPFIIIIQKKFPINNYTYLAIFCSLFSLFIVLSLPIFRGYTIYGAGDTLSHLGMIKDIIYTGHVGFKNPYPITHILVFNLASILSISIETIALFLCQLFVLIYIISLFLLMKSLNYNQRVSLLVLLLSIVPVMGSWLTTEYIMPSTEAFSFIPLTLFVFIKSRTSNNNVAYSVLLVMLLLLFPFFHPEATIFLLISLIVLAFILKINKVKSNSIFHKENVSMPILLLIVGFLAWFSSTYIFGWTIQSIYDAFILNLSPTTPPIESAMSGFSISPFDEIKVIIIEYGAAILYLLVGLIFSLITFKKYLSKKANFNEIFLSLLFVVFVFLSVIFLTEGTTIGFHIYRQLKYPIMIATMILGVYLFELNIKHHNKVKNTLIYVLIFIIPMLTLISIYPSPVVHTINYQVTESDILGMNFFFSYRNSSIETLEIGQRSYQTRFKDYIYGYEQLEPNIQSGYTNEINPPAHFGYDTNLYLSNSYNESQYLLIYPPYEYFYPRMYSKYPNLWRYTPNDFKKLNNDPSVSKLYDNGEFKLLSIK